jgi:hypothetical protein
VIRVDLDHVRLVSLLNLREHWSGKAKRAKMQRGIARLAVAPKLHGWDLSGPLVVTITRLSPGTLDSDNLAGSGKHVRDGIADALGVDDGDPRIEWRVVQVRSKSWGCRIEISKREAA